MSNKEHSGLIALGCVVGIVTIGALAGINAPQEDTHGTMPSSPPLITHVPETTEYPEALPLDLPTSITLVPCEQEDSGDVYDCYWDAEVRGNHVGRSFVVIDGTYYFSE